MPEDHPCRFRRSASRGSIPSPYWATYNQGLEHHSSLLPLGPPELPHSRSCTTTKGLPGRLRTGRMYKGARPLSGGFSWHHKGMIDKSTKHGIQPMLSKCLPQIYNIAITLDPHSTMQMVQHQHTKRSKPIRIRKRSRHHQQKQLEHEFITRNHGY